MHFSHRKYDISNEKQHSSMKAMTKQQLANSAGVTVRTLMNWCRPYRKELLQMGLKPGMKVLPPHIVKWIADRFSIDLNT